MTAEEGLPRAHRLVRLVAAVSLAYDVALGIGLLFFQPLLVAAFGLAPPLYPVNGNLNGLFALAVGLGYLAVWRAPERNAWYLGLMGVGLKGGGVAVFLYDRIARASPPSFLLFALADGTLALASLVALGRLRAARRDGRAA